jgi:hypothetical protein
MAWIRGIDKRDKWIDDEISGTSDPRVLSVAWAGERGIGRGRER